jgi:cell division protease FtsH
MVGADLANLVNEAALLAARRGRRAVTEADFSDALEPILLGAQRKILMSPEDRRRTAYHEDGHALVGMLTPRRRPRTEGFDHPPRAGARRHLLGARFGPRQL